MNSQHDPYLVTVKRNLNEQRILASFESFSIFH